MTGKRAILRWLLGAVLLLSLLIAGCSSNPEVFTVHTGEMFTLGLARPPG